MAPKAKKKPQTKPSKSKPQSSAPKLQISEENERRLRRLLLNTNRPPPSAPDDASRPHKARRLRAVYDKLSLEGFANDQIERALSALNENATFESALDWLCFNIPGSELPLKFSRGASTSISNEERTIRVISTAREDWVPSQHSSDEDKEKLPKISIRKKGYREESLEFGRSSQAEWIRQYMEHQEQEEEQVEDPEQHKEDEFGNCSSESSMVKDYHLARLAASEAKQRKDRAKQEYFGRIIRKIRQHMASLGLSDEILASDLPNECDTNAFLESTFDSLGTCELELETTNEVGNLLDPDACADEPPNSGDIRKSVGEDSSGQLDCLNVPDKEMANEQKEAMEEIELDNLFSEDCSSDIITPEAQPLLKKEKSPSFGYSSMLGNIDDLWRKGDSIPKAVLQKLCQRLGWEAPKYKKLFEKENKFLYSVTILRTATGRGKNRKAGGLITIQLPETEESCSTAEDAQNNVATFALCQLFSDIPIYKLLTKPYATLAKRWLEERPLGEDDNGEEHRRTGFVDSLLDTHTPESTAPVDSSNIYPHRVLKESCSLEQGESYKSAGKHERVDRLKQAESNSLRKELEDKAKMPKYMEMLKSRSLLPISKVKNDLLQLLRTNDVIVVCGETGCGKTTQVPQFILDDMIESSLGGYCNIICTQPRRIAAISVAERVSNERCESPPGTKGSLIGFQVRLESSRHEKTKLLFCTTGILLRKLAGDKDLAGVTHVVVDEVHERSLLGDFLLIVLKKLIEKRAANGSKLKVILMSATMNSNLFLSYFNNCPLITAEGRTHPVTPYFLEDIYEQLNYTLPSDSPASGGNLTSAKGKLGGSSVDNRRGKKNLVLSAWGDESLLSDDYINPCYIENAYETYSGKTRQNLKNLNEDVIDYDLLEDLICFIDENYPAGAILVFLPGVAEIDLLVDKLIGTYRFGGSSADWILPLHSSLASSDQRKVFLSPPENIRKIIVSTDIAETSITIDDVVYVIDSGKHKEKRYNPQKKMSSMVEDWVSRANAKQRRGRAGRVKPGICFCLYTRYRLESLMRSFQVPEILRMPLGELCLQIKSLSLGDIKSFLSKAIEPPSQDAITSAISLLYEVGALEGNEELTPLGYHLAKLPVDVLIGKMMVYGSIFGCLSPTLSIAAFLSYKSPFLSPKDEKQNVERAKVILLNEKSGSGAHLTEDNGQSDHMLLAIAYNKWSRILQENGPKAVQQFCRSFFLNSSVMYMIRDMRIQFGNLLADIGLISLPSFPASGGKVKDKLDSFFSDTSQSFNTYSHHPSVVKSIMCAGLYPNIAATSEGIMSLIGLKTSGDDTSMKGDSWYDGKREVHVHPSSVNFSTKKPRYPFMVFLEKVETSKIFLRDTTIVSPYSVLLFGGSINVQHQIGIITVDSWLKLTAPAQIAVLFKELRLTLSAVLKELIQKPEVSAAVKNEVVKSIVHLLVDEDKPHS